MYPFGIFFCYKLDIVFFLNCFKIDLKIVLKFITLHSVIFALTSGDIYLIITQQLVPETHKLLLFTGHSD